MADTGEGDTTTKMSDVNRIMPIKAHSYQGRPAFNQAWAMMTREFHTEMLAKPPPRKLRPDPDPEYVQPLPVPISRATLNYRPSKRISYLSRVPRRKFTPKYKIRPVPEHFVEPYNLTYVISERILELSEPRKLVYTVRDRKVTRKPKRKVKSHEKEREEWLQLRAAPRRPPPPPPIPKWIRRTTPLSPEEREIRIFQLSTPPLRYILRPEPWDPYQVNPKSQRAMASKRTLELAAHRELPLEAQLDMAYKPFAIKKGALRYKATPRIVELAEPVIKRAAAKNEFKEDAFQVPARALKAMCSKRTKELAKPVVRRGF